MNEELAIIEPQLDQAQQEQDLQTLQQPTEAYEPTDERYASVLGSFTRAFSKQIDKQAIARGEKLLIKKEASIIEPTIERNAMELGKADLSKLDPNEPYQINFDTINNSEDVKATLGKMNELNNVAIMEQRRQIVPDVELKQLADDLSSDPETIKKVLGLKAGEILPPEYILSMKDTLVQSSNRLRDLSTKIVGGNATDQEKIAFHKQWEFHSQFNTQFMGVRAEYGRGLRAMGVNMEESVPMGEIMQRMSADSLDPLSMAQQILLTSDNKSLNRVIQLQKGAVAKTSDAFSELFISSILSGIQTHVVNVTGTALRTIAQPLDTAVASLFKADGSNKIVSGEGMAQLKGMMEASWEALVTASRVLKSGEAYGGVSKMDVDYHKAISANAFGIQDGTTMASFVDNSGKFIRFSTDNLMGSEDAFFKVLSERGKSRQLAHREAVSKGLSGQDYDDAVAYMMANPSRDMQQQSTMAGLEATFQGELGKVGQSVQKLRNTAPAGRYIMPFIKTPLNILYEGFVERTPLAMVSKKYQDAIQKGGAEAQMAKAKMTVGTAFNSALVMYAMNGNVTGAYPKDAKLRQAWRDAGVQPNSFVTTNEDGTKEYQSFDRLEPFNTILSLYANLNQAFTMSNHDELNPEYEKEFSKIAVGMAAALTEATVNKTFMKGLSDILGVMQEPKQNASNYVKNMVGSFIPQSSLLRNITKQLDPITRDADGILTGIGKNIPWLSENHVPVLDNFGKPVKFDHNLVPAFWKGGVDENSDPIRQEIARLADVTKEVAVYKPSKNIGGYRMTAEEYHYYCDQATNQIKPDGKNMYDMVKEVMKSYDYEKANDYMKSTMIEAVRNNYYEGAKKMLLLQYPKIRKYSTDKKEYEQKRLQGLMDGIQ